MQRLGGGSGSRKAPQRIEPFDDPEVGNGSGSGGGGGSSLATMLMTGIGLVALIAIITLAALTYDSAQRIIATQNAPAATPPAPTPSTYATDAATGCIYTNAEVVALDALAREFYACVLYHDLEFSACDPDVAGECVWADFRACYWDLTTLPLSNNTAYLAIVALDARLTAALADADLKTTEKLRLAIVHNEVALVRALVEAGHVVEATAAFRDAAAWYEDPMFAIANTFTALTAHNFSTETGYDARVLAFIDNATAFATSWTAAFERAVDEGATHADVVMDAQSAVYEAYYGTNFSALCATLVDAASVTACGTSVVALNDAYAAQLEYYTTTYLAACDDQRADALSGVGSTTNGVAVYDAWLAYHLGLVMAADDIYALGVSRVAANKAAVVAAIEQIDDTITTYGGAATVLADGNDARFFVCTNDTAVPIALAQNVIALLEAHVLERFGHVARPRATVTASGSPFAYSTTGAYDATTNAWVTAPGYNIGRRTYCDDANNISNTPFYDALQMATAAHETVPGHGLQSALEAEVACAIGGPWAVGPAGYTEGLACYAEEEPFYMGVDDDHPDGLYTNPSYLLSLRVATLLRNARLKVDAGVHGRWTGSPNMTYTQCVAELVAVNLTTAAAEAECLRYIQMPGQATAYMIGMIDLLDIRDVAAAALDADFDVREFHNLVMRWGAMRLIDVRRLAATWVAYRQAVDPDSTGLNALFGIDIIRADLRARTLPDVGRGRNASVTATVPRVHNGTRLLMPVVADRRRSVSGGPAQGRHHRMPHRRLP
jgi:uncharacterized protein (DUF885 family)